MLQREDEAGLVVITQPAESEKGRDETGNGRSLSQNNREERGIILGQDFKSDFAADDFIQVAGGID
jgi:hypothetical protein